MRRPAFDYDDDWDDDEDYEQQQWDRWITMIDGYSLDQLERQLEAQINRHDRAVDCERMNSPTIEDAAAKIDVLTERIAALEKQGGAA